jgi:hypothetical protein
MMIVVRYTYAVDKTHTATSKYNLGSLHIQDMNGNKITGSPILGEAIYVLVSHGADTKGAYNRAGVRNIGCTAGALDTKNCDGDDLFVDAKINDSVTTANFYDDLIAWQTQEHVYTGQPIYVVDDTPRVQKLDMQGNLILVFRTSCRGFELR